MPVARHFPDLPLFDPRDGVTVVPPPGEGVGFWAGAPSACYDAAAERFLLSYRLRRPVGQGRGYRCVIAASGDGIEFETVWALESETWGTASIERSALVPDPRGGWRLYISSVDPVDNRWRIDLLCADTPEAFDLGQRQEVMTAASTGTEGVKDPVAWILGGLTWMLVPYGPPSDRDLSDLHATGNLFATGAHPHPTALAISADGVSFRWLGDVLWPGTIEGNAPTDLAHSRFESKTLGATNLECAKSVGAFPSPPPTGDGPAITPWDASVARASAIVWVPPAWYLFYDGRTGQGDIYEDRTGLAVSLDGRNFEKATPAAPLLASPWGSGSLRYLDVVPLRDRLHYYYECCRPDGSHELRLNVVPLPAPAA